METNHFKGIIIRKIAPANPDDPRGDTYELWKGIPSLQTTMCERRRGYAAGNHYHKGEDPSKNPERVFLCYGKVLIKARNPEKQELEITIKQGTELLIYPNVLHSIHPLDDIIIFLESRSTEFDKHNNDTYPADTYDDYIKIFLQK